MEDSSLKCYATFIYVFTFETFDICCLFKACSSKLELELCLLLGDIIRYSVDVASELGRILLLV